MVSYHHRHHRALIALFSLTTRAAAFSAPRNHLFLRGGACSNTFTTSTSSIHSSNINGEEEEPRTGWLHNTEPKYATSNSSSAAPLSLAMKRLIADKMQKHRHHRIIAPPAAHPCGGDGTHRLMVTEHKISVPLTHADLKDAMLNSNKGTSEEQQQRIVPVTKIDGAYTTMEAFNDEPTIDVYFTITELLTNAQEEAHFYALQNPNLTASQRAALYFNGGSNSSDGVDPSRMMLYLQGGPGFGCAAPISGLSLASTSSSWAAAVLLGGKITNSNGQRFQRIVLMDQRGTGKSSAICKQSLMKLFPDLFLLDAKNEGGEGTVVGEGIGGDSNARMMLLQARQQTGVKEATDYLSLFRADSIVRDAEWIREALTNPFPSVDDDGNDTAAVKGPQPWGGALGQSFGGFCLMTYLSSISNPPELIYFTGGIAPMNTPVREVYDKLWLRVRQRSWKYYEQYPGDVAMVKKIVRTLLSHEKNGANNLIKLPSGGILTARRFLQIGLVLGGSPGSSFANLHSVINSAFVDDDSDEISNAFLKRIDYEQSFDDAPLYFLLHESIYADGDGVATQWAANQSYKGHVQANSEFDYRATCQEDNSNPTLFFGEMVFPFMAHGDFSELSNNGMRMLSEALAEKSDWLPLFDESNMRAALVHKKKSRAAAACYYDDMYVDFECAMKLVQRGCPLEGVKVYVTNDYQHSGLRDDGATIINKLVAMSKNQLHVPS